MDNQHSLAYLVEKPTYPLVREEWLRQIAALKAQQAYVYYTKVLVASMEQKQRAVLNGCPEDEGEVREREQLIGEIRGMKALEQLLSSEMVEIQQQLKEPTNENPDDSGE